MSPLRPLILLLTLGFLGVSCGCRTITSQPIELPPPVPPPSALTPADRRITDEAIARDRLYITLVGQRVSTLPAGTPVRAAAETWHRAAREEYEFNNRSPWVGDALARADTYAADGKSSSPVASTETESSVYRAWIEHRLSFPTLGFRAALPLIETAEFLGEGRSPVAASATAENFKPGVRPSDLTDRLWQLQLRLARLHLVHGLPVHSLAWAKAQAWLDFARDEHHQRDRSGIVADASAQAEKLIDLLEALSAQAPGLDRARAGSITVVGIDAARSGADSKPLERRRTGATFEQSQPYLLRLADPAAIRTALAAAVAETPFFRAAANSAFSRDRSTPPLRADLWLATQIQPDDFAAGLLVSTPIAATRARLSVLLAQAELEHGQRGWRPAEPYFFRAEKIATALKGDPSPATGHPTPTLFSRP